MVFARYGEDFDDNTPTPTMIRPKAVMGDLRYHSDKEALINSARSLWNSPKEPAVMGFLNEHAFRPSFQRSAWGGTGESTDGSLLFGAHEEFDVSSYGEVGEDAQRSSDEKLLAMLGDMAKGSPDEDDGSDVMSLLPLDVHEEDPHVRMLLDECSAMWEQVASEAEANREMQNRLRRELRQLQERSERQYQETAMFMERLHSAKGALADKMKEVSGFNQDLRGKISHQWRDNERLSCTISEGVKGLTARAAELSAEIWEVSDTQATLVEQLNLATETQARLQAELQEERVKTWRQSTDVVMAFAQGSSAASWHVKVGESSASACLRDTLARQAKRVADLQNELAEEEANRSLLESQLDEVSRRASECGIKPPAKKADGMLAIEGPGGRELSDDLGEAEDAEDVAEALEPEPVREHELAWEDYVDAPDVSYETLDEQLAKVEELKAVLLAREAEAMEARTEETEASEKLNARTEEFATLHTELIDAQERSKELEEGYQEADNHLSLLRGELHSEQAALREEEQAATRRRELFRSQVDEKRRELHRMQEENDRLIEDLENRSSCLKTPRRPPPPPARDRGRY